MQHKGKNRVSLLRVSIAPVMYCPARKRKPILPNFGILRDPRSPSRQPNSLSPDQSMDCKRFELQCPRLNENMAAISFAVHHHMIQVVCFRVQKFTPRGEIELELPVFARGTLLKIISF